MAKGEGDGSGIGRPFGRGVWVARRPTRVPASRRSFRTERRPLTKETALGTVLHGVLGRRVWACGHWVQGVDEPASEHPAHHKKFLGKQARADVGKHLSPLKMQPHSKRSAALNSGNFVAELWMCHGAEPSRGSDPTESVHLVATTPTASSL